LLETPLEPELLEREMMVAVQIKTQALVALAVAAVVKIRLVEQGLAA
jgi:hypothetical protein